MLYLYGESALGWNTTLCVRVRTGGSVCVCVRALACSPVVCRDFLPSHLLTPQMLQTGNDFDSYSAKGVCEMWVLMSFWMSFYFLRRDEMKRTMCLVQGAWRWSFYGLFVLFFSLHGFEVPGHLHVVLLCCRTLPTVYIVGRELVVKCCNVKL